jgi:MFS family permease
VLRGYYPPFVKDIARHLCVNDADVHWLEDVLLMLSGMVVPALSKVGDLVGHRPVLAWSTAITLGASPVLVLAPSFWLFPITRGSGGPC